MKKILLLVLLVSCHGLAADANKLLTLQTAEKLAVIMHPQWLDHSDDITNEQDDIPDIQFSVGLENSPLPDNPTYKDDNSVVQLGVKQVLPLGDTIYLKHQKTQADSIAERYRSEDQKWLLLRNLRQQWVKLYESLQEEILLQAKREAIIQLIENPAKGWGNKAATNSLTMYADQLTGQLEELQKNIEITRARLASLIGEKNAQQVLVNQLPQWPTPPSLTQLEEKLAQHPKLQADLASISSGRATMRLGKEKTKPKIELGLNYGMRQDNIMDIEPEPAMIGLELTLKLPGGKHRVSGAHNNSSRSALEDAQAIQQLHYQQLKTKLITTYASWQALQESVAQGQSEKKQTPQNSLNPENMTQDRIKKIIQAYNEELNGQLNDLHRQVNLARARVDLLYYE